MITRVRKLLLEQPDPQYKVAARIGIDPSTLSRYALGREPIKSIHLVRICRYFQVPVEQVIGYVDEQDIVDWAEEYNELKEAGN